MTFDRQFCEDLFDILGRNHALRHAYRAYLWRRALGVGHRSLTDEGATPAADLRSAAQALIPPGHRPRGLNALRSLSFHWRTWN
jgi:hypothetical protein